MSSNVYKIHPVELLKKQFIDDEFIRWDTIIRCIAAEHYIETRLLHPIYFKDCMLKHFYVNGDDSKYDCRSTYKNYSGIVRRFIRFNEFSISNPVGVSSNLILFDGTHRLGTALALDLDFMYYEIIDDKHLILDQAGAARLDWYKERFTPDEIKLMTDKYQELIN